MMNIFLHPLLFTIFTISSGAFSADGRSIEVTGRAKALVAQHSIAVSVLISEQGRIVSKTNRVVEDKTAQVVTLAKRLGVEPDSINVLVTSIHEIQQDNPTVFGVGINHQFANGERGKVYLGVNSNPESSNHLAKSFQLSQEIIINFPNIYEYEQFLNSAIKMGLARISPVKISDSAIEEAYQQALMDAIKKAKRKAHVLAKELGFSLGNVINLTEQECFPTLDDACATHLCTSTQGAPQSNITVSANVKVIFAIK